MVPRGFSRCSRESTVARGGGGGGEGYKSRPFPESAGIKNISRNCSSDSYKTSRIELPTMFIKPVFISITPLLAAVSARALPEGHKKALPARRNNDAELFIGLGLNTTVSVNGLTKTCVSESDNELFALGPGPFEALPISISYNETGTDGITQQITQTVSASGRWDWICLRKSRVADDSAPSLAAPSTWPCSPPRAAPVTSSPPTTGVCRVTA